jgi:hypothetical protein
MRRFLHRTPPQAVRQLVRLHDRLRNQLFDLPRAHSIRILDLDSVVLTVYGEQQGSRVGYNPKKKGRRSYYPLLCFESSRQEFWHGSFRPGNAAASTGAVRFMERCLTLKRWHLYRHHHRRDRNHCRQRHANCHRYSNVRGYHPRGSFRLAISH